MAKKRSQGGLLSRLAAPLAKAARRVAGRGGDGDETEARELMAAALAEAEKAPAQMTDDSFRLFTEQLAREEQGSFQVKLHIISLVEFREAVGDKWPKLSEKVLMIAEGVINSHLGAGNIFCRQGSDAFALIFRTCDNVEGRRRSLIIAQELGTRLVGDQFVGAEVPLALAAELDLEEGLNDDGSINMAALDAAVSQMRSIIASQANAQPGQRSWMRGGGVRADDDKAPRRSLMPGQAPPRVPAADSRAPIAMAPEPEARGPVADPEWKKLEIERAEAAKQPTWIILEGAPERKPPQGLDALPDPWGAPLPPDAKLSLVWRPTWVAAGEVIGAYEARVQRVDSPGTPALEGVHAYPKADEPAANTLDRFRIAAAIRDFRASETAGNSSTVVIPIHWLTLTAENRMEFLAPFADITKESRSSRVIIELFGVPAEVKPMALGAAIARARELCRMVVLRTSLTAPRAAMALDCGAAMVGVDLAELAGGPQVADDDLLAALNDFQAQAAKARLGTFVWGARRRKVIVGGVQAGFALVNGPALMKDIPKPAKLLPAPKARFTQS